MKRLNSILQQDNSPPILPLIPFTNINQLYMKPFLTTLIILAFSFTAKGQLEKGVWLAGGTGSFLSSTNTYTSTTLNSSSNRLDIAISANVGYFIADKFAIGLRSTYSKYKESVSASGIKANIDRIEFGPFVRYYFLNIDKPFNLLSELNYKWGKYLNRPSIGNINTFSANAGTVIFFNTSVGMELLVGYYSRNEKVKNNYKTTQNGFQIVFGFQIHLEN